MFGRLPGGAAVDGGLFHRRGNFAPHGFAELATAEAGALLASHGLADVGRDRGRLLCHRDSGFVKGSSEGAVARCKWATLGGDRI